jgi:4-carboxymuconolactone decarboxylase
LAGATKLVTLRRRGLGLRRRLFGAPAVRKRMEAFGAFGAPLQDIINGYVYGDVWSRRGLGLRERSLVMVAMTAALNRPNELRVHVQGAVKNRCTPAEIREVLLLVAMYCGVPAAIDAHRVALEVFAPAGAKAAKKRAAPRKPRKPVPARPPRDRGTRARSRGPRAGR